MTNIQDFAEPSASPGPSKTSDRAARLAIDACAELWHDKEGNGYLSLREDGHLANHLLREKAVRRWLTGLFYRSEGRGLRAQDCQDALNLLEAMAVHEGDEHPVAVRVAHQNQSVFLDLGTPDWRVIHVSPVGWSLLPGSAIPVRFRRPPGLKPLPMPLYGGQIQRLSEVLNADGPGLRLALAWLVFAIGGSGPYPILALAGEQGTGKSNAARILRSLVDPAIVDLRSTPKEERDLAIAARNAHVLGFDNFSTIPEWLSDALCRLATGAGFATRTLFTDADEMFFNARRPIIINGIPDLMTRGDLADRALAVTLARIPDEKRIPEGDLWAKVDSIAPEILGGVLDAVSTALRRLPEMGQIPLPRMADFARFILAAEPALPWPAGAFMETYLKARTEGAQVLLEGEPLGPLLLDLVNQGNGTPGMWTGTAGEMLTDLQALLGNEHRPTRFPSHARGMTAWLTRTAPALRQIGIDIEHSRGGGKANRRITTLRMAPTRLISSEPSEPSGVQSPRNSVPRTECPQPVPNRPTEWTATGTVRPSSPPSDRIQELDASGISRGSDGSDDAFGLPSAPSDEWVVVDP